MGDSVRASHLLVKHGGSRRPASWRDPDGSKFIKAKTKAQALAELAAFRARIVAGEDFSTLAKQFSDCGSASAGGDLGVFGRCVVSARCGCACALLTRRRPAAARCRSPSRTPRLRCRSASCRRVRGAHGAHATSLASGSRRRSAHACRPPRPARPRDLRIWHSVFVSQCSRCAPLTLGC